MEPQKQFVHLANGQVMVTALQHPREKVSLVFLHMTPLSSAVHEKMLTAFNSDVSTIAIDTPGFGGSADFHIEQPSIDDYARINLEVLKHLKVANAIVVGQHTGASTAVEMALIAPDVVRGVVFTGLPYLQPDEAVAHLNAKKPFTLEDDGSHAGFLWRRQQEKHPGLTTDQLNQALIDELIAGPEQYMKAYTAVYTYPIVERLAQLETLRVPTYYLYGSNDCIAQMQDKAIAQTPSARRDMVDGATDFIALERPQQYADLLHAFATHANEKIFQEGQKDRN